MPLLLVIEVAGPAAHPPAGSVGEQAREGPLPDDVPLELGQRQEEVETSMPPEVVVSMVSCKLRKPTLRSHRPVTVSMRCFSDLPRRSSFQGFR